MAEVRWKNCIFFCTGRGKEELKNVSNSLLLLKRQFFCSEIILTGCLIAHLVFLLCGVLKKVMFGMRVSTVPVPRAGILIELSDSLSKSFRYKKIGVLKVTRNY